MMVGVVMRVMATHLMLHLLLVVVALQWVLTWVVVVTHRIRCQLHRSEEAYKQYVLFYLLP